MAVDLIAYKTLTVRQRMADVGVQLFNATNHFNPRDVDPVAGARNYGRFTTRGHHRPRLHDGQMVNARRDPKME